MTIPNAPLSRSGISLTVEPPDSAVARQCMASYFAELARRFEGGFDPGPPQANGDLDMARPGGCFLVARIGPEIAGCGGLKRLDAATGEIKRVWVTLGMRGRGVARAIVEELERFGADLGFRRIRLDTNRALGEAQAMYAAMGYREIARYNDNPYADRWFEKRL